MSSLQLLADLIGDTTRADDTTLLDQALLHDAVKAPLTLDDFYELLEACQADYAWELDDMGQLVGMGLVDVTLPGCPPASHGAPFDALTAVCYSLTGIYHDAGLHWDRAADEIDLPLLVASEVVCAEDRDMQHDPALRARLLQLVGLAEEARHE